VGGLPSFQKKGMGGTQGRRIRTNARAPSNLDGKDPSHKTVKGDRGKETTSCIQVWGIKVSLWGSSKETSRDEEEESRFDLCRKEKKHKWGVHSNQLPASSLLRPRGVRRKSLRIQKGDKKERQGKKPVD